MSDMKKQLDHYAGQSDDVGFFPIIDADNIVRNKRGDRLGEIRWHHLWDCPVFLPDNGITMGPAFIASLAAQMIAIDAKHRKEDK